MRRLTTLFAALGASVLLSAGTAPADDPLLRPIAPDYAARWLKPQPPAQIYGNSYLVGFGGLSVGLIRTDAGLILIDGAVPQAVPAIEANIRALGFDVKDVKYILSTEPHYDHAGGIAALARDSGATVLVSPEAAPVLRSGQPASDDLQAADLLPMPGVTRLRVIRDGETFQLGDTVVTAHATPGHTAGSMSWTWQSCEASRCLNIVFASSLNPIASDGYRFSDPRNQPAVASFRRGFTAIRALPCDILLSAHPEPSGGDVKFARLQQGREPNPYIDRQACRAYADKNEALLDAKIAKERD